MALGIRKAIGGNDYLKLCVGALTLLSSRILKRYSFAGIYSHLFDNPAHSLNICLVHLESRRYVEIRNRSNRILEIHIGKLL